MYELESRKVSTSSGWALVLDRVVTASGLSGREIFLEQGVDLEAVSSIDARFPTDKITSILEQAAYKSGNEYLGLAATQYIHSTMFHGLSIAFTCCSNLYESFSYLAKYSNVICSAGTGVLSPVKNGFKYSWGKPKVVSPIAMDCLASAIFAMCRSVLGEGFTISELRLMHDKPESLNSHRQLFGAAVEHNADEYAFIIPKSVMELRIPTYSPELLRCNEDMIINHLDSFNQPDFVSRVFKKVDEFLLKGEISEELVACSLNMSKRSLQRRLQKETYTFRKVLELYRKKMSLMYLERNELSINEISYMLGFSAPSNFSRAFFKWSGKYPSQYRLEILAGDGKAILDFS